MTGAELRRLRSVAAEVLEVDIEDLEPGLDFFEDLNIDRADLADLIVAIEDAFGIVLEAGISDIATFGDLEALVDDEIG